MSAPYAQASEHRDDQLALIARVIERRIAEHWERGFLPRIKDDFSGTFVSGGEVRALLAGGLPVGAEAASQLAAHDAAIEEHAARIEARLAATRADGPPLPWDRLRDAFALSATEQRALWVLLGVELSPRIRQLARYLVNEASRSHADVGLLDLLVYADRGALVRELAPDGTLFRHRLVEPIGSVRQIDDAPFLAQALRAGRRVVELAEGWLRLDPEVATAGELIEDPRRFDHLRVDAAIKTQVVELLRRADGTRAPVVVLAGSDGSGRRSLVQGAAAELARAVLRIDCRALPTDPELLARMLRAVFREAVLFRAVPLFESLDVLAPDVEAGRPDRARVLDAVGADFTGAIAATCARRETRPVALLRGLVMVDVPLPDEGTRVELWREALGASAAGVAVEAAAARYRVSGGIIGRAAAAAVALAASRGGAAVTDQDLHAGLRGTLDAKLSGLGMRIEWRQTWDDLVLPEEAMLEIRELIARVRHKRRVFDEWGFGRKLAKGLGLSALFSGPPGTGKTMVAGLIADELALDLYQIDLSRIVSKYVGETEKNLSNLFDAAEAGHAILLFDEADSLFAKRTDVKSSVDRYANLEVNYLLQRIESFSGITILTTNLDSSIDEAFRRRLSFRISFPFPDEPERELLWTRMLPREAAVADGIDLEELARRYEMTGGHIRNAVLRAAFLAAADEGPIGMSHLRNAAALEYAAMGKVMGG